MRPRLARVLIALTTFVVVWIVAPRAAHAFTTRAPVCDPRGAIMFAPPPQLQDPEQSLDAWAGNECADAFASRDAAHRVERERAPLPTAEMFSHEPAVAGLAPALARGEGARVPAPAGCDLRLRPGHRPPLDRPPRA